MSERLKEYKAVLFDTDLVLADTGKTATDFTKRLLRFLGKYFEGCSSNLNFSADEIQSWYQIRDWSVERGIPKDLAEHYNKEIWNRKIVLRKAKVIPGSQELVRALVKEKENVSSATSRPSTNEIGEINKIVAITLKWMWENFPEINSDDVHINPNSDSTHGPEHKAETMAEKAEKYGNVLLVEDFPGHAEEIIAIMADKYPDVDYHIVLVAYAKISVPDSLRDHPRVTVVERGPNQGIEPLEDLLI